MLANIISQTHILARFGMDSNVLVNIIDFELLLLLHTLTFLIDSQQASE